MLGCFRTVWKRWGGVLLFGLPVWLSSGVAMALNEDLHGSSIKEEAKTSEVGEEVPARSLVALYDGDGYFNPLGLCDELWVRVFEYLSFGDMGRLARVNGFFVRILQDPILLGPRVVWPDYARLLQLYGVFWRKSLSEQLLDAVREGPPNLSERALSRGADVDVRVPGGMTALSLTMTGERVDVFYVLLDYRADVSARDRYGWSPLHCAAQHGLVAPIHALADRGADVNVLELDGWTPLHIAAQEGYADAVRALLARGADPSIISHDGMTVLDVAINNGRADVVNILLLEVERRDAERSLLRDMIAGALVLASDLL